MTFSWTCSKTRSITARSSTCPTKDVLYNPRLRVAYEVRGDIPVMLPDESRAVDDAEHQSPTSTTPRGA
jgi:uncharacterized protein YbaR (Trm112 family)